MKKAIAMLVISALCLPGIRAQAQGSAPPGTPAGTIYETDIAAFVDGMAVPSYNIGGKTVVVAEDLMPYGFDVVWDAAGRSLSVTTKALPGQKPAYTPVKAEKPGRPAGKIYATDIVATVNGMPVESYNLGGRTALVLEDMANTGEEKRMSRDGNIHLAGGYSIACMKAAWDPAERTVSLECVRPGDTVETNLGVARILGDRLTGAYYTMTYYTVEDGGGTPHYDIDRINIGGYDYFDAEALLNAIGIKYIYDGKMLEIDGASAWNKCGVGDRATTDGGCVNVLFPLDIGISVDGKNRISSEDYAVAYEYRGKVMVRQDLIGEAVYHKIYRGKYDLPEGCTEKLGDILASRVLVYINDMAIPSYASDLGECYLAVNTLSGYGFGVEADGGVFRITTPGKVPDEPPLPPGIYPETYADEYSLGRILYPVYNGIYEVTLDGAALSDVYIWSVPTTGTPCVSALELAELGGYRVDGSNPMELRIYTEK